MVSANVHCQIGDFQRGGFQKSAVHVKSSGAQQCLNGEGILGIRHGGARLYHPGENASQDNRQVLAWTMGAQHWPLHAPER